MPDSELSDLMVDTFVSEGGTVQRCESCDFEVPELSADTECAGCGDLLDVLHAAPAHADGGHYSPSDLKRTFDVGCCRLAAAEASGVWRYLPLIMPSIAAFPQKIVSHPEGNTPVVERPSLGEFTGCRQLLLKHEGHNPTGSFKDRGMTVGVTQAVRIGATAVACASTGNTSASLSSYASQAGIPGLVFVPAGKVATGKLSQTLAYGAKTLVVRGDFDDCLRLAREASRELGIYLLNSVNPWRIEGQKTIVFELLQQLGWLAPEFMVLPAGNLGNTSAFGKALREAFALGLIDKMPRLVSVQAQGAAPFVASFPEFSNRASVRAETVATAIRIGDPASWNRAVRAIRQSNGLVISCTDDEIVAAKIAVDAAGVGCEAASAASVAGVRKLVAQGVIRPEQRVVAVLTGHVLKDPGMLELLHRGQPAGFASRPASSSVTDSDRGGNPPIEIDATVSAVEQVLRGTKN